MEQAFFMAKELHQSWADIEAMGTKERNWLYNRLIKFYADQTKQYEKEADEIKRRSSGRLSV